MLSRGAWIACVARRLSRRDFEVFFLGTAMSRATIAAESIVTPTVFLTSRSRPSETSSSTTRPYSTSATRARSASEPILELLERRPARVELLLGVLVRLDIQVATANRAEAGAVGPAEDLFRQRERDQVA